MDAQQILDQANDAITVRRVFGEPIERDGVTVVPVAVVFGGGGGGTGQGPSGESGWGSGYGVHARPAGVFVIGEGQVKFEPAVDVSRIAITALLLGAFVFLRRGRKRRRR